MQHPHYRYSPSEDAGSVSHPPAVYQNGGASEKQHVREFKNPFSRGDFSIPEPQFMPSAAVHMQAPPVVPHFLPSVNWRCGRPGNSFEDRYSRCIEAVNRALLRYHGESSIVTVVLPVDGNDERVFDAIIQDMSEGQFAADLVAMPDGSIELRITNVLG
jgi:hypothetical protein